MMENKIHLSQPPNYNQQSFESNALYYRSKADNEECIILLQSHFPTNNQRISKYHVTRDKFIPISPKSSSSSYYRQSNPSSFTSSSCSTLKNNTNTIIPFKTPKLSQIISNDESQLLTMINTKNQISMLNLNTYEYIDNYQLTYNDYNHQSHHKSYPHSLITYTKKLILLSVIFTIFWQNNAHSTTVCAIYSVFLYLLAQFISNYAVSFEKDIKCVIPNFEDLFNVTSCSVDDDGIYFVANDYDHPFQLKFFKFNIKTRLFEKLKAIKIYNAFNCNVNGDGEASYFEEQEQEYMDEDEQESIVAPYRIIFMESMQTLIMFTNTENIYYYDLREEDPEWRVFEDVKLPKVPGPGYDLNICIAFKGIMFLFYSELSREKAKEYENMKRLPSEESDSDTDDYDEDGFVYCWDLIFSGQLFQCDTNYEDMGINRYEHIICTQKNWAHFMSDNGNCNGCKKPYHFKINLAEEIPIALSIQHLQVYHSLIKQYILENNKHKKLSTDIEMVILDYFPMFL